MVQEMTLRAIGYMRVSTEEQGDSRAGLEAQEALIKEKAAYKRWELLDIRHDVSSGASMKRRTQLGSVLRDLKAGKADVLIVAKLDRLSRSVMDFASIMEMAQEEGWSMAVLDLDVDTSTTNGKLIMNIMISLAQWEREVIGDRTKAALKAIKARGVKLGRKSGVSESTLSLISALRSAGLSYQGIADVLISEGVKSGQGGKWQATTVRRLYIAHQDIAEAAGRIG